MPDSGTLCYHRAYAMPTLTSYHMSMSDVTAHQERDRPFDLLLQSGTTGGGDRVDIGIRDGRIAAVARMLRGATNATIALDGRVVLPGFVESHTHLDKALSAPPARNHSGTLYEAIEVMGEIFSTETTETIRARALRTAEMFLAAGATTIRTHVDVHKHIGLAGLEALLSVREAMRGRLDLQIVALSAQLAGPEGTRSRELYEEAVCMGIDAVGGAPALDGDPRGQIDHVFALALRHDLDIDLHMDESDDPRDFYLPYLAERTIAAGYQGRVVAGHCCALSAVDDTLAAATIEAVREARIAVVTLPSCNLYLQGRSDRGTVRRGLTRVRELQAAGVPVCCGSDNIQDPFNPFGRGDLLMVANLFAHAAHLGSPDEQALALASITGTAAAALRLTDYGLVPGCAADLVVLDNADPATLLATVPPRRYVLKAGRVVAETRTTTTFPPLMAAPA